MFHNHGRHTGTFCFILETAAFPKNEREIVFLIARDGEGKEEMQIKAGALNSRMCCSFQYSRERFLALYLPLQIYLIIPKIGVNDMCYHSNLLI